MIYSKEFLDLQIKFAHKVALLTNENIDDAIERYTMIHGPEIETTKNFGCFAYYYEKEYDRVHVHLNSLGNHGVLSSGNIEKRKEELRNMFEYIKQHHPEAKTVFGFSWLLNRESFNRLMPVEFTSSIRPAKIMSAHFQYDALWGQFIDGAGNIRKDETENFLNCIESKTTLEEVTSCFPCPILRAECDVKYFYDFYGV